MVVDFLKSSRTLTPQSTRRPLLQIWCGIALMSLLGRVPDVTNRKAFPVKVDVSKISRAFNETERNLEAPTNVVIYNGTTSYYSARIWENTIAR